MISFPCGFFAYKIYLVSASCLSAFKFYSFCWGLSECVGSLLMELPTTFRSSPFLFYGGFCALTSGPSMAGNHDFEEEHGLGSPARFVFSFLFSLPAVTGAAIAVCVLFLCWR